MNNIDTEMEFAPLPRSTPFSSMADLMAMQQDDSDSGVYSRGVSSLLTSAQEGDMEDSGSQNVTPPGQGSLSTLSESTDIYMSPPCVSPSLSFGNYPTQGQTYRSSVSESETQANKLRSYRQNGHIDHQGPYSGSPSFNQNHETDMYRGSLSYLLASSSTDDFAKDLEKLIGSDGRKSKQGWSCLTEEQVEVVEQCNICAFPFHRRHGVINELLLAQLVEEHSYRYILPRVLSPIFEDADVADHYASFPRRFSRLPRSDSPPTVRLVTRPLPDEIAESIADEADTTLQRFRSMSQNTALQGVGLGFHGYVHSRPLVPRASSNQSHRRSLPDEDTTMSLSAEFRVDEDDDDLPDLPLSW